jgi:hypothetical protein
MFMEGRRVEENQDEKIVTNQADATSEKKSFNVPKKLVYSLLALLLLGGALLVGTIIGGRTANAPGPSPKTISKQKKPAPTSDGSGAATATACADGKTLFQDKSFGAQFCYPTDWGTATLNDAKVAAADSGHREVVRFSSNPYVIVGGMSDDWSTSVGRGVGCLEPDNVVPPLSAYDTSWHGIEGSGADVSYAVRSLPSSAGGYSVQESVSNLLVSGVCVQGHKVISGSRYRVVAVNYARDFAPASGITTPPQHMAEPNVLFSTELRAQYDALLASLVAY